MLSMSGNLYIYVLQKKVHMAADFLSKIASHLTKTNPGSVIVSQHGQAEPHSWILVLQTHGIPLYYRTMEICLIHNCTKLVWL